jgi:hypothetical protein
MSSFGTIFTEENGGDGPPNAAITFVDDPAGGGDAFTGPLVTVLVEAVEPSQGEAEDMYTYVIRQSEGQAAVLDMDDFYPNDTSTAVNFIDCTIFIDSVQNAATSTYYRMYQHEFDWASGITFCSSQEVNPFANWGNPDLLAAYPSDVRLCAQGIESKQVTFPWNAFGGADATIWACRNSSSGLSRSCAPPTLCSDISSSWWPLQNQIATTYDTVAMCQNLNEGSCTLQGTGGFCLWFTSADVLAAGSDPSISSGCNPNPCRSREGDADFSKDQCAGLGVPGVVDCAWCGRVSTQQLGCQATIVASTAECGPINAGAVPSDIYQRKDDTSCQCDRANSFCFDIIESNPSQWEPRF